MPVDPLRIMNDAAIMAEYRKSLPYEVINHYLELMGDDYSTQLINGIREPERMIWYWQGVLLGLRLAQEIPEKILILAKQTSGEAANGKIGSLTLA